ncbi:MAG: ATP-binding cassette domain-containing protein [Anaerolineales bacterium]
MTIALETFALTRRFDKLLAVDSLSLAIQSGETFGLLGPNGAGKTTTIKMLTTLLPPTSGNASIAGFDLRRHPADVRRVIGYVPQLLSADGTLTGRENLEFLGRLYDIPRRDLRRRVDEGLEFMGLQDSGNKLVREYSGGMIRRLEVAQSMLHRPPILFLDEPTTGLDPVARRRVWELIRRLRKNFGTTILLTTHLMEEADRLCRRVAVMNHGVVATIGSPAGLKKGLHKPGATLDDVFIHYTGKQLDTGGTYRDISRTRRVARRLG